MAKYLLIVEGYDPTSDTSAITRANLLAMVHEGQPSDDSGWEILADLTAPPDVATYPVLGRFRWAVTSSGVKTGVFYYWNGSSWVIERPAPGTIDGDSFADGTIGIEKLDPTGGDPLDIIRVNAGQTAFVFAHPIDLFANWTAAGARIFTDTAAFTTPASDDYVMLYDTSGTTIAKITIANLLAIITGGGAAMIEFVSYTADKIPVYNGTDGRTMTPAVFAEQLIAQAPVLTTTATGDKVLVLDVSAADQSQAAAVELSNLLPLIAAAGTTNNPTSITITAQGLVTAVSSTGGGKIYSTADASLVALPTLAGAANRVSIPHGLGGTPSREITLVCTDAGGDANYAQNAEVDRLSVLIDTGASDFNKPYQVSADATNIYVTQPAAVTKNIQDNISGADAAFDSTKWKARGFAIL